MWIEFWANAIELALSISDDKIKSLILSYIFKKMYIPQSLKEILYISLHFCGHLWLCYTCLSVRLERLIISRASHDMKFIWWLTLEIINHITISVSSSVGYENCVWIINPKVRRRYIYLIIHLNCYFIWNHLKSNPFIQLNLVLVVIYAIFILHCIFYFGVISSINYGTACPPVPYWDNVRVSNV